jgi:hypothetical protein
MMVDKDVAKIMVKILTATGPTDWDVGVPEFVPIKVPRVVMDKVKEVKGGDRIEVMNLLGEVLEELIKCGISFAFLTLIDKKLGGGEGE